jgi:hypothetical protein
VSFEKPFTPKSLDTSEYVRSLFDPFDNVAILLRDRRTAQVLQRITRADTVAEPEFQSWLKSRNHAGADIFIGMNPIKDGAYNRTKENIKEIRHVYLDLDRNGEKALKAIHNSLEVPPPNFVLDTSPGKHQVVWRIEGISLEPAEALLHDMASHLGGDPAATDATRVLRLPGFANRKLAEEFVVQVVQESAATYSLRDFNIPEESPETPRHLSDSYGNHRPAGHPSQSERDWAYAKRALARGDDPREVIRRIADYRAEDKHDPIYYAQLTVTKAEAQLSAEKHASAPEANRPERPIENTPSDSPTSREV